jgi:hypothetical protein
LEIQIGLIGSGIIRGIPGIGIRLIWIGIIGIGIGIIRSKN